MFDVKTVSMEWGGKTLTLETGRIARQADGAVLATYGETVVLCAVTAAKSVKEGQDFFPLTVHYQEKYFAAGRIPGGFFKRERGATEKETLVSRLIDRPVRPLFPEGFYNEINVIAQVLSYDGECEPDVLAMIAASAALTISGVPFMGPIGAARVGFSNGEYVLNPSVDDLQNLRNNPDQRLDLVIAGTKDAVMMVESEAYELTEAEMLGAVKFGHASMQPVIDLIIDLAEDAAKEPFDFSPPDYSDLYARVKAAGETQMRAAFAIKDKQERTNAISAAVSAIKGALSDLPSAQPVANELAWVIDFNAQVRRSKSIIEGARPHVSALVGDIADVPPDRRMALERALQMLAVEPDAGARVLRRQADHDGALDGRGVQPTAAGRALRCRSSMPASPDSAHPRSTPAGSCPPRPPPSPDPASSSSR